jgi:hypothetical protein
VPAGIAAQIPEEARKILEEERELIRYCRSKDFSLSGLSERLKEAATDCDLPWRPK